MMMEEIQYETVYSQFYISVARFSAIVALNNGL